MTWYPKPRDLLRLPLPEWARIFPGVPSARGGAEVGILAHMGDAEDSRDSLVERISREERVKR